MTRGRKRSIFVVIRKPQGGAAREPTDAIATLDQPNQKHVPEPVQATVLTAFSFGVAKAKSRALNEVARGLTFLGIPDTVETRLRRFISDPRIDMADSCKRLARSVIRALPRKKPVILLVDETGLRDKLKAMVVSVAYEGRAIRGGDDDVSSDSVADRWARSR